MATSHHGLHGRPRQASLSLISSYVLDWLIIIAVLVVSFVIGNIDPNRRPFALDNPGISFPFTTKETIPTWLLLVLAVIFPIIAILILSLLARPRTDLRQKPTSALTWRLKLWELHAGWLGLALSITIAWFVTNGMKNLFGKPRPDLLARCDPDLANAAQYVVGGVSSIAGGIGQLYSADICKSTDTSQLRDGFRSFPSGHSSSSAAGLGYLTLLLASKLALGVPVTAEMDDQDDGDAHETTVPRHSQDQDNARKHDTAIAALRNQFAAPPLYLLVIVLIPLLVAIFIASSRWFDFRHGGFDILFGFFIGTVAAVFAFRYYHLPIARGGGSAWAARSRDHAWGIGRGDYSYAARDENETVMNGRVGRAGDEENAVQGSVGGGDDSVAVRKRNGNGLENGEREGGTVSE